MWSNSTILSRLILLYLFINSVKLFQLSSIISNHNHINYSEKGGCKDLLSEEECREILNKGECNSTDKSAEDCPKTCGNCPGLQDDDRKKCEDKFPNCKDFTNPVVCCSMKQALNYSCEKSCGFCKDLVGGIPGIPGGGAPGLPGAPGGGGSSPPGGGGGSPPIPGAPPPPGGAPGIPGAPAPGGGGDDGPTISMDPCNPQDPPMVAPGGGGGSGGGGGIPGAPGGSQVPGAPPIQPPPPPSG